MKNKRVSKLFTQKEMACIYAGLIQSAETGFRDTFDFERLNDLIKKNWSFKELMIIKREAWGIRSKLMEWELEVAVHKEA